MGTRTRHELELARAHVQALEARLAEEEAAMAQAAPAVRELAVEIHGALCQAEHPAGCDWLVDPAADDAQGADWTQGEHQRWLQRTQLPLGIMVRLGWKLFPPGSTEPLALPE